MGTSISTAIKEQQQQNNQEVTETMQMMHKMLVNKIAATSSKMENDAIEDKSLPIVAVVDKSEKYKVRVSEAPSAEINNAIGEVLSGDFLDGLKSLVTAGLNQMLGNASAGETERVDFHIVFANNSLLRIDYMMYKYNFSSRGIIDEVQNVFCYYLQVGVLDLEKVNPQILLYELTRAIGESRLPDAAKRLQNLTTFAKDLYKVVHELDKSAMGSLEEGSKPNKFAGGNASGSAEEKEQERKKAILTRYHKHKHAPFLRRRSSGGGGSGGGGGGGGGSGGGAGGGGPGGGGAGGGGGGGGGGAGGGGLGGGGSGGEPGGGGEGEPRP